MSPIAATVLRALSWADHHDDGMQPLCNPACLVPSSMPLEKTSRPSAKLLNSTNLTLGDDTMDSPRQPFTASQSCGQEKSHAPGLRTS